jgi:hypothetical protein
VKKPRWALYGICDALERLGGVGCCGSCWEDQSYGYDPIEMECPEERCVGQACCAHANLEPSDESARRTWWAILLQEIRRQK